MVYTQLIPRHTEDALVEEISRETSHYRLWIPSGKADAYRLAQLDDYAQLKREQFLLRYPLTLSLSARVSSESIPGTWGFGLWNDPFGLSLGFGGNPFRLPALPNTAWFFGASSQSYLSFRDDQAAGNGFLTQTFRSPKFHSWLILAGMALPFSRKIARRLMGRVIQDEEIDLCREGQLPFPTEVFPMKVTQWHRYKLDWREKRVSFEIDDVLVFESQVSPHPPLGLVIWIDNQYAAFTPEGKIGFGVLENVEPAWLEVKEMEINYRRSEPVR